MSETIPVAVFGATGKMGRMVCAAVDADPGLELVGRLGRDTPREEAALARVTVDFTVAESAVQNLEWSVANGKHAVVGTSGMRQDDLVRAEELLAEKPGTGALVVPNFSVSALLSRRFARQAAELFDSVELIEYYPATKVDAPSGTAVDFARSLAGTPAASAQAEPASSRGEIVDGVPIHAVRMAGFVSRQDAIFGNGGEFLTIRFETVDRAAYMAGVVRAIKGVVDLDGLHWGLDTVIG